MAETRKPLWLLAEYCPGPFYMGWHLYLRESRTYQRRNSDGDWGWIRRPKESRAGELLKALGFVITGDGTTDRDGIGQFARRYPLSGRTIADRPRGGVKVFVRSDGTLTCSPRLART